MDIDPAALDHWDGWGSLFHPDWETASPADLWDGRHEHNDATHHLAHYPDPEHCDLCLDGALWVIEFHRDAKVRAAAHAARNARMDVDAREPELIAIHQPAREEVLELAAGLRRAFATESARGRGRYLPSNDQAFYVALHLLAEEGWHRIADDES